MAALPGTQLLTEARRELEAFANLEEVSPEIPRIAERVNQKVNDYLAIIGQEAPDIRYFSHLIRLNLSEITKAPSGVSRLAGKVREAVDCLGLCKNLHKPLAYDNGRARGRFYEWDHMSHEKFFEYLETPQEHFSKNQILGLFKKGCEIKDSAIIKKILESYRPPQIEIQSLIKIFLKEGRFHEIATPIMRYHFKDLTDSHIKDAVQRWIDFVVKNKSFSNGGLPVRSLKQGVAATRLSKREIDSDEEEEKSAESSLQKPPRSLRLKRGGAFSASYNKKVATSSESVAREEEKTTAGLPTKKCQAVLLPDGWATFTDLPTPSQSPPRIDKRISQLERIHGKKVIGRMIWLQRILNKYVSSEQIQHANLLGQFMQSYLDKDYYLADECLEQLLALHGVYLS